MKKYIVSTAPSLVGIAGVSVISNAISFGWYAEGERTGLVLKDHAIILIAAGIGLLAAGYFIRQYASRISALEEQLALLHKNMANQSAHLPLASG